MKRIALLLAIVLCLTLCGCPAAPEGPVTAKDVHITAGKIEPGMTARDVLVEVTIDHEPVPCTVELTCFTDTGYYLMEEDEAVPEEFYGRLDVYYSLPKGYDVDNVNVTMECDGGEYDGTGSIGDDENGCIEAWSHAIYDNRTQIPTTQPQDTTAPQKTTVPEDTTAPQEQTHTHSWQEQSPAYTIVSCTQDSEKSYTCACGQTKKETVPAPGHDLKYGTPTPATCTQPGSQTSTCTRCGAGFIDQIPATGHSWSAWIKITGLLHQRTCSTCGEEEKANHNIPSGSVTCTDCGEDIIN